MKSVSFASLVAASVATLAGLANTASAALTWTTAYSQASSTTNQLRSVAVADDDASVYLGFIQTSLNRRVDRLDTTSPYANLNTFASGGDQPKGIAVDDRGNVFISNRGSSTTSSTIRAHSATLVAGSATSATTPVIGGLTIQRVGSTYYAYAVYESGGLIQRYDVTNPAAMTLDTTFGTSGSYVVPSATSLREIEIAADGTLYIASRDDGGGRVYKVAADLSSSSFVSLTRAFGVALYDGNVYVSRYNGNTSSIAVLNSSDLSTVDTINITTLDGNPYARGTAEGWSGLDIDSSGRLWLADQSYGSVGGTQDRLLVSSPVPEPTSIAAIAGLAAMGLRRRRA